MCERKVLNKYYPPDFDPEKLASRKFILRNKTAGMDKRQKERKRQMQVRMMLPFTMCCEHCGEFNYIGKKFNSRVNKLKGEDYLGIPIWRFYGKCPNCCGEFSFRTDPKNTDYVLETGGTRTYEPLKDAEQAEKALKDQLEDISGDVIKSLEHKTYNTANELAALEQLDDLKRMNKRLFEREKLTEKTLAYIEQKNKPAEVDLLDDDIEELEAFKLLVSSNKSEADIQMHGEEFTDENTSSSEDDIDTNKRTHFEIEKQNLNEKEKDIIDTKTTGVFASNIAPKLKVIKIKEIKTNTQNTPAVQGLFGAYDSD